MAKSIKGLRNNSIVVQKPLAWYNKEVNFDFKEFFSSASKAIVSYKLGDVKDIFHSGIDALKSISLKDDLSGQAYKLILHAALNAIYDLSNEVKDKFDNRFEKTEKLYEDALYLKFIDKTIPGILSEEFYIDDSFFYNPKENPITNKFKLIFNEWLKTFGLNEIDAESVANRFPSYFVYELNTEWKSSKDKYGVILLELDTPFTKASKKESEWENYNSWLEKQAHQSVFDESFSLKQIYIPLRAYYIDKKEVINTSPLTHFKQEPIKTNVIVDLQDEVLSWVKQKEKKCSLKVISGGPGSGKSSFLKILASEIAQQKICNLIYIPLHLFNVKEDFNAAFADFVKEEGHFSFNPLDELSPTNPFLIIFDGLDELSKQGNTGAETAKQFLDEINRKLSVINSREQKLSILLAGREISVQSNQSEFRELNQIYNVLPYFVSEEMENIFDPQNLLKKDQRIDWWAKYYSLKGKKNDGIPTQLRNKRLEEITSQPLLNYLVALSWQRGKITFSNNTNLNEIYWDLIKAVYERKYEKTHISVKPLSEDDFIRILEEIAITAWHGGDARITTVKKITEHLENGNLSKLLEKFKIDAQHGVTQLLTAFYFRQKDVDSDGNKTFEFTHKSFGEYLISRRIINTTNLICRKIVENRNDLDTEFDEKRGLEMLFSLTSKAAIDEYIHNFLMNEIVHFQDELIQQIQKSLCDLISYYFEKGMIQNTVAINTNDLHLKFANFESSLFIILNVFAVRLKKVSEIKWPNENSFGNFLSRINPQRNGPGHLILAYKCFSYLNLAKCNLQLKDLYSCNFSNSILDYARLDGSFCLRMDLKNASLKGASFELSILDGSDLSSADMTDSNFHGSSLANATFKNTVFDGARFIDTTFAYLIKDKGVKKEHLKDLNNITFKNVKSIIDPIGLPESLEKELRQMHPKLFKRGQ